jgi:hypothetical protein
LGEAMLKRLGAQILATGEQKEVEYLKGIQSGVWGLFGDMLVVRWTCPHDSAAYAERIRHDAGELARLLPHLAARAGIPEGIAFSHGQHEGVLSADQPLAPQWRMLFAQAIIQMEHPHQQSQ